MHTHTYTNATTINFSLPSATPARYLFGTARLLFFPIIFSAAQLFRFKIDNTAAV